MGVGKTIQTLAFILSLRERTPGARAILIVLPRSLVYNWLREAATFAPSLTLLTHIDQGRAKDPTPFDSYDVVLTTYGTMLRDIEFLAGYRFQYVILDESQAIKNPAAETARAVRRLQGDRRLSLTGTPIENNAVELWSQFAFLNPGLLGTAEAFRETFAREGEGREGALTLLRRLTFPFILRRTKDQVAPDLPSRTEHILMSDMEPEQRRLYTTQRDHYRALLLGMIDSAGPQQARVKMLEGLLRLRQICNHPRLIDPSSAGGSGKFEALLATLESLKEAGHRVLVFSQFVQMLTLVRTALDERGIAYAYLDGRTRDRQSIIDAFQNDTRYPFFLISLRAGGVGLNLTAADYVIHIDPWWNPAVEMQATDRTHRIGQTRPVMVYKMVVRDSVEEKILQLQERKRELVSQLITPERGGIKTLTRADVELLFT
jgi:non-specific serine/threonine protein kinase